MTTKSKIAAITASSVQCAKDKGKFEKKAGIPQFEINFTLFEGWEESSLYLKALDDQGNQIDPTILPIQNPFEPKNFVAKVFVGRIGIRDVPDNTKVIFELYSEPSMTGKPIASNQSSGSAEFTVVCEGACP